MLFAAVHVMPRARFREDAAPSASALYNDAVAMTTNAETTARARTSILFSLVVVKVVVVKVLPDDDDDDDILLAFHRKSCSFSWTLSIEKMMMMIKNNEVKVFLFKKRFSLRTLHPTHFDDDFDDDERE